MKKKLLNVNNFVKSFTQNKRADLTKNEKLTFQCENKGCDMKDTLFGYGDYLYCSECIQAEERRERLLKAEEEFNDG